MTYSTQKRVSNRLHNLKNSTIGTDDIALLRAALCDGDIAIDAFMSWKSIANPEHVHNEAHFRLLPLLYDNLVCLDVQDALMPRLKQTKYRSWVQAQKRIKDGEVALKALAKADVPTIVTKGIALIDGYYASPALRPMSDIDLVVQPDDLDRACDALGAAGWANHDEGFKDQRAKKESKYRGRTMNFEWEGRTDIDLHWQPFHECLSSSTRDAFWKDAEDMRVGKATCLRPTPDKLLFHVITHGMRPNALNPIRWIADAAVILRMRRDKIDWPALYEYARKARLLRRLRMGLEELESALGETFPPLPRLMRPSLVESLEQSAFRAMRKDMDSDAGKKKILWSKRIRVLGSDAGRSADVWLAFADRIKVRSK